MTSCGEQTKDYSKSKNVEYYAFFDPFAFKGVNKLDSINANGNCYELHFDTMQKINKIIYHFAPFEEEEYDLLYKKDLILGFDTSKSYFGNMRVMNYIIFYPNKVISFTNFKYSTEKAEKTGYLNIFTKNKNIQYSSDRQITKKKFSCIKLDNILLGNLDFDDLDFDDKKISTFSQSENDIIVQNSYKTKDTILDYKIIYNSKYYNNYLISSNDIQDTIPEYINELFMKRKGK